MQADRWQWHLPSHGLSRENMTLHIVPAILFLLALLHLRPGCVGAKPDTDTKEDMKSRGEALIGQSHAEMVAVAFHDMATGEEILLHPDERFHPASTFKAAVMMEVFHQAQQGSLSLDERIPIKNTFVSIADG